MSTKLDPILSQRTSANVYGADIFNCSQQSDLAGPERVFTRSRGLRM